MLQRHLLSSSLQSYQRQSLLVFQHRLYDVIIPIGHQGNQISGIVPHRADNRPSRHKALQFALRNKIMICVNIVLEQFSSKMRAGSSAHLRQGRRTEYLALRPTAYRIRVCRTG